MAGRMRRPNCDHYFTTLELSSGADGARTFADGHNAMRCGAGNAGSVPIEADEMTNPLLFEKFEIAPDTGGAGKFRGGKGSCGPIACLLMRSCVSAPIVM